MHSTLWMTSNSLKTALHYYAAKHLEKDQGEHGNSDLQVTSVTLDWEKSVSGLKRTSSITVGFADCCEEPEILHNEIKSGSKMYNTVSKIMIAH